MLLKTGKAEGKQTWREKNGDFWSAMMGYDIHLWKVPGALSAVSL